MPSIKDKAQGVDRRASLKLLAGTMSLLLARCSRPEEEIIPYTDMPEGMVAGELQRYATTLTLGGYGRGFLGITIDGRPIKIEGNGRHPAGLGATDIYAEAEVLSLYDPDRAKTVRHLDQIATWDDFHAGWSKLPHAARIGLVTGRIVSPTSLLRIEALRTRFPSLRRYRYEAINDDAERQGSRQAFGRVLNAQPDWRQADVILCLDADPLGHGPDQLRIARAYADRRSSPQRQRLHVVEAAWTLTGAAADARLALPPHAVPEIARHLANAFGASMGEARLSPGEMAFAQAVADELRATRGRALVLAGPAQSPDLHALCHWLNQTLEAPITYRQSLDPVDEDHAGAFSSLIRDIQAGALEALVILDCNPVYDAPQATDLAQAMARVPFSVHAGLHADETAAHCHWQLPLSHALESWGDARATDGTVSFVQPLIRPLFDTRTGDEIIALLADNPVSKTYDLTRATWRARIAGDFESWWRRALHDGLIADSAIAPVKPPAARLASLPPAPDPKGLVLVVGPHHSVWDGRHANNAWLQECPAPFTKEVWGNALHVAPEDARKAGLEDGDTADLSVDGKSLVVPVAVMLGQARGVLRASWGQGRSKGGRICAGIGFRYADLSKTAFTRHIDCHGLKKSDQSQPFYSTQSHTRLQGRTENLFPVTHASTLTAGRSKPPPLAPSLLPVPSRDDYAWAMVVDTDACIGCNACVVACQAENNVPVVGPEEISQGRDMHWLRVDSYALMQQDQDRRGFQPVPCMHCELAPCEPVCPVEASVHDHEGLNVQVYNRCIGTRFCEANCPYKVRRFNWFDYSGEQAYRGEGDALKAQHNPDVSVRGRGVMEKCNYCLQRISRARRAAEKDGRRIAEGEMVTACQAACPTRAIHFGDLNTKNSDVASKRQDDRHYTLLEELNTRPRTTFLKRVYDDDPPS